MRLGSLLTPLLTAAALLLGATDVCEGQTPVVTRIFSTTVRPKNKEPRPFARFGRSIVLRTRSWANDPVDEGQPWLDIDLMIELGDVNSFFEGVEVQYELRKALLTVPCGDPVEELSWLVPG